MKNDKDLSDVPLTTAEKQIFGEEARRLPSGAIIEMGTSHRPDHIRLAYHPDGTTEVVPPELDPYRPRKSEPEPRYRPTGEIHPTPARTQ